MGDESLGQSFLDQSLTVSKLACFDWARFSSTRTCVNVNIHVWYRTRYCKNCWEETRVQKIIGSKFFCHLLFFFLFSRKNNELQVQIMYLKSIIYSANNLLIKVNRYIRNKMFSDGTYTPRAWRERQTYQSLHYCCSYAHEWITQKNSNSLLSLFARIVLSSISADERPVTVIGAI